MGGCDGTGVAGSGRAFSIRDLSPMSTPGRVGSRGALRGRSPRTREGRIGPTAQKCSSQWLVVSGQRGRIPCPRVERGMGMASSLRPETVRIFPTYI